MRNETRKAYNAYLQQIATLNGVPSAVEKFAIEPSVQQTIENKIQDTSAFLKLVNNMGVTEQKGEKLGLGIGSTVASTTDTTAQDRQTQDPSTLDDNGYECTQTNFDTHLRYSKLDAWAKFSDFQQRIRDQILQRQALDMICIGFNGTSRAATSDRTANPLLEDVNVGWLEKYRNHAGGIRVMSEVVSGSGQVRVGLTGSDYKNLDAVVYDAVSRLIEPWYREDTGLRVILGRALMADKYFPLINSTLEPTETLAADLIISQKRIGGLQAMSVPFFPANALMITRPDNLSRYYQIGGRRRTIKDNVKRDQIENYESSNDAYVVEDYACGCVVENISFV